MIRLENVQKVYEDGFQALNDINLEFKEGELNVLIGPSGCGKTTTMKLLNRLIDFTDGKIYVNDKDITQIDPIDLRRSIGYVIQSIGLFPHMTIYNNVAAVPKLLKWDKERIDKRVHELLDLVGLEPDTFKYRYPSELSGGQQQRIGVIRALAAGPSMILMDEPFSALDPISREQLQDELVRLQKEIKKTIVFVTHDMDEALKIADQIILMKDGEIVQRGTPDEIVENPVNEFVEEFIGKDRLKQVHTMPVVDEVMTNSPVTVKPELEVSEAMNLMGEHQIDSLLVVDSRGQLKGQISIYEALKSQSKRVSEVMKPVEHSLESGTSLKQALEFMNNQGQNDLPVMDGNKCIGLVTKTSMIHVLAERYSRDGNEGK
jgi:osmoprotectant transport system ATP-binding protein